MGHSLLAVRRSLSADSLSMIACQSWLKNLPE
jgi:hypothetical protein